MLRCARQGMKIYGNEYKSTIWIQPALQAVGNSNLKGGSSMEQPLRTMTENPLNAETPTERLRSWTD